MKIETLTNIGQVVYHPTPEGVRNLTVGQIRIELEDTPGIPGEEIFDNFKPSKHYSERVMCIETGIGTGSVYVVMNERGRQDVFLKIEDAQKKL